MAPREVEARSVEEVEGAEQEETTEDMERSEASYMDWTGDPLSDTLTLALEEQRRGGAFSTLMLMLAEETRLVCQTL